MFVTGNGAKIYGKPGRRRAASSPAKRQAMSRPGSASFEPEDADAPGPEATEFERAKYATENFELLDIVWDFCRSGEFTDIFEGFIKENVAELRRIRPLDEEQDVAFTHLFQKMMKLFEARISQYVDAKGFTVEQFYDQCRTITESKEEVSEDLEDQLWFVQQLLACTTYEKFHEIVSNAIAGRETKLCTK
jgi:hypothetical protein